MKKILVMCLSLCISLCANAQATDLVVDCQTPGWLSSKINYGDQLTVKNLKVTGYINETDLKFIASLFNKELNGVVDLGDVTIDGGSWDGSFTKSFEEDKYHLQKLILPKTLSNYEEDGSTYTVEVDTLVFDINVKVIKGYDYAHHNDRTDTKRTLERKIGHLIIGERTDSILNVGRAESVHFPSSLRYLENYACSGKNDFTNWNIKEFPNLKFLGHCAFTYNTNGSIYGDTPSLNNQTLPDSIFLPQIIVFNMASFDYKEGMHIFLGEHFRYFSYGDGVSWSYPYKPTIRNISFHMKKLPDSRGIGWCDSSVKVYIPKGTTQEWIAAGFTNVTLIEDPQPLEGIELNFHEINLEVNESVSLIATPIPANADNVDFIWSSDNLDVCTVNAEGVVKALKSGKSNIITMSSDGIIRDTCKVTVIAHADSIALSDNSIELSNIGESYKLEASVFPDNAINKSVTWKSYNEQVCTVSDEGLVTATGIGSTLVTATTVDGGLTANCIVKVIQHVEKVSLNKVALELKVNESEQLIANVSPDNADNKTLTWSSSNNQVATVDANGNVQALKAGEAWIKAVSEDNKEAKDSCKVTINQPVTEISLSQTNIELSNIGESVQLEATVMPEDASDKSITWKSNNEQVCIVSSTGMVTAIGAGTTVVTATTNDGGKMAFCIVNVSLQEYNITLDQYTMTLNVGETAQLHATVTGNTTKTVNWSSSNDQIVAVDNNGNVTAIKVGNALIYATLADLPDVQTSCAVTVNEVDGILEISGNSIDKSSVYDATGRQVQKLKKGLNIVRMKDGTTRKVVLK